MNSGQPQVVHIHVHNKSGPGCLRQGIGCVVLMFIVGAGCAIISMGSTAKSPTTGGGPSGSAKPVPTSQLYKMQHPNGE